MNGEAEGEGYQDKHHFEDAQQAAWFVNPARRHFVQGDLAQRAVSAELFDGWLTGNGFRDIYLPTFKFTGVSCLAEIAQFGIIFA